MLRSIFLSIPISVFISISFAQSPISSDSRLTSVIANKVIQIAYRADAKPFSFADEKKAPAGYTIDLCMLIVKSVEQQLKIDNLKVEWVPITVQTRFSAISSGKADMECGATSVSLSRMEEVDFSLIYFVETTAVLVLRTSNIRSFSDMAGRRIATIGGTTNEGVLAEQSRLRALSVSLVSVQDRNEGVIALETGKVDGFASDKLLLIGAQLAHPEGLMLLPDDLSVEKYAIGLPRGDWAFRLAINKGLARVFRSGQILEVFNKWFGRFGMQPESPARRSVRIG